MHILYLVFRVILEGFVLLAIGDLIAGGNKATLKAFKERKRGVAYASIAYTLLAAFALVLRLYFIGPVVP